MCFVMDCQRGSLLGSKDLGTNVFRTLIVMLANQDQNKCLSCFRLAQCVCINIKLESSGCRSISDFRLGSINRRTGSIDRISSRMLFSADFQLSPSSFKTFRVLYFCPKYIRQTLATF